MSGRAPKSERRLRHVVLNVMGGPFTLPLIGGSLLAAVVLGIHLGESTVGMIDPVHFRGPAIHPRDRGAAIDARRLARSQSRAADADLYGWDEGRAARTAECGDCGGPAWPGARVYSAAVPYFGESGREREPAEPAHDPVPVPRVHRGAVPDGTWDADAVAAEKPLERYAHFPLTYEDAAFLDEEEGDPVRPKDRRRW